jgi:hypothetical protein
MKWSDITLAKFQQIEQVNRQEMPDIDKALFTTCIVFDKTEHQLDNENPKRVMKMMGKMQSIFETPFNPNPKTQIGNYVVNYDMSRISLGQYVELSYFITKGVIGNAHFMLASMASRRRKKYTAADHRAKADYFHIQPVELIIGAANLIKENYDRFNSEYKSLFGIDTEVTGDVENDEFNKRYGWIYSATQVAQHEGITLDAAFGLPIRQAFNDLMFIKAKGKYEMEQLRKTKPVA